MRIQAQLHVCEFPLRLSVVRRVFTFLQTHTHTQCQHTLAQPSTPHIRSSLFCFLFAVLILIVHCQGDLFHSERARNRVRQSDRERAGARVLHATHYILVAEIHFRNIVCAQLLLTRRHFSISHVVLCVPYVNRKIGINNKNKKGKNNNSNKIHRINLNELKWEKYTNYTK